jgi:ABC-type multidrug transport system permease subunit
LTTCLSISSTRSVPYDSAGTLGIDGSEAILAVKLMLFLSGATFPLEMMPGFIQHIAKVLPLYYVIDLLRQTWNFSPIWKHGLDVAVLAGMFVGIHGACRALLSLERGLSQS